MAALDKPKVVEHHSYKFFVQVDDGEYINLKDEDAVVDLPSYVACRSVLKAVRYILETGEGQSILDRAVTVMRRYRAYLPQFANDTE